MEQEGTGTIEKDVAVRPLNVLVVDDHEIIREAAKKFLRTNGFAVVTAPDGEEALLLMKRFTPDVVVLDLEMPVMNGPETLKHIKERFGNIPVVILTGFANTELMTEALKWSPFTVVRKPMEPEKFVNELKAAALTKSK